MLKLNKNLHLNTYRYNRFQTSHCYKHICRWFHRNFPDYKGSDYKIDYLQKGNISKGNSNNYKIHIPLVALKSLSYLSTYNKYFFHGLIVLDTRDINPKLKVPEHFNQNFSSKCVYSNSVNLGGQIASCKVKGLNCHAPLHSPIWCMTSDRN